MAKELNTLLGEFRNCAELEDEFDAIKVACYIKKLQINGVIETVEVDGKDDQLYLDLISKQINTSKNIPVSLKEISLQISYGAMSVLKPICKELNGYTNLDLKNLVKEIYIGENNRARSYHDTSFNISELVHHLMNGEKCNSIADLCSGAGSFLISNSFNGLNAKLTGYEMNPKNVMYAKMMGYVCDCDMKVNCVDVLATEIKEKYDVCFTEFPLGLRYKQAIKSEADGILKYDHIGAKVDWAFVFKAINAMKEDGKTFAIMSQGSLYNSAEMKSRKIIIDNQLLEKVILMPEGTLPGSIIGYSLLVFSNGNENVQFIDARESYSGDKRTKTFDLDKFKEIEKNASKFISNEEIKDNEYVFEMSRYLDDAKLPKWMNPTELNNVADVLGGYVYNSRNKIENPVSVKMVKVENFDGSIVNVDEVQKVDVEESRVSNYLLQKGDILLASKGTIIKAAILQEVNEPCIFTNNIIVIRVKEGKMIPEYLLSYLNGELGKKVLSKIETGSVIKNIPLKQLKGIEVPVVDMDTQEVICNRFNQLQIKLKEAQQAVLHYKNKIEDLFASEVGD